MLYTANWASGTSNVIVNGSTGTVVGMHSTYGNSTVARSKGHGRRRYLCGQACLIDDLAGRI